MTTILILVACYLWTIMVYADDPVRQLDERKAITAPVSFCLLACAMFLVWLSNQLNGMDSEIYV
jgi:hypothetical protein